jgi:hypothetical protein
MEGWIQVWCIWYIARTFVNATMHPNQRDNKKKVEIFLLSVLPRSILHSNATSSLLPYPNIICCSTGSQASCPTSPPPQLILAWDKFVWNTFLKWKHQWLYSNK